MSDPTEARSRVYFFSDVHLGVGGADRETATLRLIRRLLDMVLADGRALYIVGDLFDFWYEYRHVVPRGYHALLTALEDLVAAGVQVTYLAGNHDFGIGDSFTSLGVHVVRDDVTFTHEGRTFWVYHGDGLAVRDGGYRAMKKVLRNPLAQTLFRWLHPDLGFRLARMFSHGSRDYTSTKFYGETDGMRIEAERRIRMGADFVVMGHRHLPSCEAIGTGTYVNLGDWLRHCTYAVYEHGGIRLESLATGSPAPFGGTA